MPIRVRWPCSRGVRRHATWGRGIGSWAGGLRCGGWISANNKKQRHTPSPPQRIEVRMQDIAAILERTRTVLSTEQQATLTTAIDTLAWVTAELQTKHTSLERLRRMLFGASTEKTRHVLGDLGLGEEAHTQGAASAEDKSGSHAANAPQGTADKRAKAPGHGRNGVAAYTGADQVAVAHAHLHGGAACPGCTTGHLYPQSEPAKLV